MSSKDEMPKDFEEDYREPEGEIMPASVGAYWQDIHSNKVPSKKAQAEIASDAQQGNVYAMYVMAWLTMHDDIEGAAELLDKCARAGMAVAVDNLLSMKSVFTPALAACFQEVEMEFPELVGNHNVMPVYSPALFNEVWRRLYGK